MTEKTIQSNSEVIMHLILRLSDGSIAENTYRTAKPVKFKMGDDSFTPAIEKELLSLKVGDKKSIAVEAHDAFGTSLPENIHTVARDKFPADLELEEGVMVGFEQPNGIELIGIVRELNDREVKVDFNHPLAGHAVQFEVEILEIN